MNIKKKYLLAGIVSVIHASGYAQQQQPPAPSHIQYTYDAVGNRIKREYVPFRLMGDTSKSDPKAEQFAVDYGIKVYPNPLMNGNNITVAISSEKDKDVEETSICLLDNIGKTLFMKKQTTSSLAEINLSSYSSGIYYIKVAIGKEQLFYKVVKP